MTATATDFVQQIAMRNGRNAGSVVTRSQRCWDGHEMVRYDGFCGGNHVGQWKDLAEAIREVRAYAERFAFSWHLALCDTGAAHSDVCPCRPL